MEQVHSMGSVGPATCVLASVSPKAPGATLFPESIVEIKLRPRAGRPTQEASREAEAERVR